MDENFLREAIRMAAESVRSGGGPFGAVVVRDGRIIGRGVNRVTADNDPTAHAEIQAIRDACRNVGDYRLHHSHLYVSCQPCPMCMAAIYWARIERVTFAASAFDAAAVGFDDLFISEELMRPLEARALPVAQLLREEGLEPLRLWREFAGRAEY